MKSVYLLIPLAALLAFGGVYWNFTRVAAERTVAAEARARADKEARYQADLADRRKAVALANAAQEEHKRELADKAARDKADRDVRQAALDARDKAYLLQDKTARQVERLAKDLEAEQAEIARLTDSIAVQRSEAAFLVEFKTKAAANLEHLQTLLTRLTTTPPPAAKLAVAGKDS